jgi:hypothetical protein
VNCDADDARTYLAHLLQGKVAVADEPAALRLLEEGSQSLFLYLSFVRSRLAEVDQPRVATLEELRHFPDGLTGIYKGEFERVDACVCRLAKERLYAGNVRGADDGQLQNNLIRINCVFRYKVIDSHHANLQRNSLASPAGLGSFPAELARCTQSLTQSLSVGTAGTVTRRMSPSVAAQCPLATP